jgi:hypothetical protein
MTVTSVLPIRASKTADFSKVRDLLVAAGLPAEDLNSAPGLRFWVAEDQDRVIGAIGLEALGASRTPAIAGRRSLPPPTRARSQPHCNA